MDFCYGSRDGQLWTILDKMFGLNLTFETTAQAIEQRERFLINRGIGICDIVASAKREKMDASDIGMMDVELRDLIGVLEQNPKIDTLIFTGGNSKNGPEYFFRRKIKEHNISMKLISNKVPRMHSFQLPRSGRTVKTVSLIAPSGAANRAVGSLAAYKKMKEEFPEKTTIDFRVALYRPFF